MRTRVLNAVQKNSGSDDDRGPFGHGYSIGSICNE